MAVEESSRPPEGGVRFSPKDERGGGCGCDGKCLNNVHVVSVPFLGGHLHLRFS